MTAVLTSTQPTSIVQQQQFSDSALKSYIEMMYSPRAETQNSRIRSIVRLSLEAASAVIVAGARGGMVMSCITGAGYILNQPVTSAAALSLGIISSTAVVLSFGAMSAFTMLKIIQKVTRKVPKEEAAVIKTEMSRCKSTALMTTSLVAGLIAQIPLAYVFYQSSFVLPLMFSVFQLLDCGRTAYSINETLTELFKAKKQLSSESATEKGIERSRDVLIHRLKGFRRALADKNTNLDALLDPLTHSRARAPSKIKDDQELSLLEPQEISCSDFISSIISDDIPQISAPTPIGKKRGRILDAFALIISGVVLSKFWQLGGQAAEMVTQDRPEWQRVVAYYGTAAAVTLANAHLWITLVNKCTRLMADFCRGAIAPVITEKLHPRSHRVFTYMGITSACLTFVPQVYFSELAFDNPLAYYPIGALSSTGTALGGTAATFALRDILLARFTKSKQGQRALEINDHLEKLIAILPKVKLSEFAAFLLCLSPELRGKLQSPNAEELQSYLLPNQNISE